MLNFGHACVCIAILLSYRRVENEWTVVQFYNPVTVGQKKHFVFNQRDDYS